jgi:hypothetical protein
MLLLKITVSFLAATAFFLSFVACSAGKHDQKSEPVWAR